MQTKSLYDPQTFQQTLDRINQITPETKPQWGEMDAAQMMSHCAAIIDVGNGKPLENTPFMAKLFKGFIRKMVVGPKPYPKSAKTHPQYLRRSSKDFAEEKQRLLSSLEKLRELEDQDVEHILFGVLTKDEKGWAQYKHLDHHLTQFGV